MDDKNHSPAIIITGGGRGLGRAISLRLASSYRLILVGRTEADLIATCRAIREKGGTAEYLAADIALPTTAEAAVSRVTELGWQLRGVVNNAGIGKSSPTHELTLEKWHEAFNVNAHGSFYFAQAALPYLLKKREGVLCFISSLAGVRGYAYEAAYTASKHAQVGLAKALAQEYGKSGITSAVICPGFIEGEMTLRSIKGVAGRRGITEDEARGVVAKTSPQRRIIPEAEVADMVELICKNTVPSLSGTPIILNGGI